MRKGSKREIDAEVKSNDHSLASDASIRISEANTQSGTQHQEGSLSLLAASKRPTSRATNGVLVCPEAEWKGHCEWTQVGVSQNCRPVPSGWERWSLGPDIDVTCFLYANTQCNSESYTSRTQTNWPGLDKLAGPAYPIAKRAASVIACKAYACKKREAGKPEPDPSNGVNAPNFQVPGANIRAVEPRGEGILYICQLPHWQGKCEYWPIEATDEIQAPCLSFPYPTSSTAVSFGPDPGVVCKVYMDDECSMDNTPYAPEINFPGWTDLEKHGSNGGFGWARYKCWQSEWQ